MKPSERALTLVETGDLRKLLSAVFKKQLSVPLGIEGLACVGLQHCATVLLGHLRGLDDKAVQAVLVAVLAERAATEEERPQLPVSQEKCLH